MEQIAIKCSDGVLCYDAQVACEMFEHVRTWRETSNEALEIPFTMKQLSELLNRCLYMIGSFACGARKNKIYEYMQCNVGERIPGLTIEQSFARGGHLRLLQLRYKMMRARFNREGVLNEALARKDDALHHWARSIGCELALFYFVPPRD